MPITKRDLLGLNPKFPENAKFVLVNSQTNAEISMNLQDIPENSFYTGWTNIRNAVLNPKYTFTDPRGYTKAELLKKGFEINSEVILRNHDNNLMCLNVIEPSNLPNDAILVDTVDGEAKIFKKAAPKLQI